MGNNNENLINQQQMTFETTLYIEQSHQTIINIIKEAAEGSVPKSSSLPDNIISLIRL